MHKTAIMAAQGMALSGVLWLVATAAAEAQESEAHWEAVKECATIPDAEARHTCTDAVLRSAGVLPAQPGLDARQDKAQQGKAPAPAATTEAAKAAPPAPGPEKSPQTRQATELTPQERAAFLPEEHDGKAPGDNLDRIEVTLTRVARTGDGRYVLTGADGVVWRQLYRRSSIMPPKEGETLEINKGVMNGYKCRVEKARSFRCAPDS